ncbi:MAG TPA: chromate efflux transporter [Terriglobales bacterium]|jgi:chromate transporter|nr:chromate efflux transporter [Terriglobales bacterium]
MTSNAALTSLAELARLFLKLGLVAFGGPPAHIAMMEDEVVSRRRWLTREQFLDFLGATNLIPGPNSTEMAIHVGRVRAGLPGLLVAGVSFILPSAVMVTALAWAYVRFGSLPEVSGVMYGVKPIVIALIVQAVFKLARTAVKSSWLAAVGALAALATALGVDQLVVLAGGGLLAGIIYSLRSRGGSSSAATFLTGGAALTGAGSSVAMPFSLTALFLVFLKIGAILFGGGYVLVALIRSNLVAQLHWISERQLLDAIAMGQVTPGPLSTAATFIGFLLAGVPGAVLATIAIFLPAFFFVAISGPLVPRLRQSPLAGAVLDGVNVAALALIAVVTWPLFRAAVVDWPTLALAGLSFFLLLRYRINSVWLVLGGAVVGAGGTLLHR